jgi:hypothetical protein
MTAKIWGVRPSELLCLDDSYTAYCFDEACAYVSNLLEAGKPLPTAAKRVSNFSDIYADYNAKGVKHGS